MDISSNFVFYLETFVILCFFLLFLVGLVLIRLGKMVISFPKQTSQNYRDLEEDTENETNQSTIDTNNVTLQDRSTRRKHKGVPSDRQREEIQRFKEQLRQERTRNTSLKKELAEETERKDDALKRLSAIMASRLKDGNPNVTDLSDQNRPVKIGEQFSELYDNQWTDAFSAVNTYSKQKEQNMQELEIIKLLLHILELCFIICKDKAKEQLTDFNKAVLSITAGISNKATQLPKDLMQRIKEERKLCALDKIPDFAEVVPKLKDKFLQTRQDMDFLDCRPVEEFIRECLKLCWLMAIQDPPMTVVLEPGANANEVFKAYKHKGNSVIYIVWPALRLKEGGSLLMKGVAEFQK